MNDDNPFNRPVESGFSPENTVAVTIVKDHPELTSIEAFIKKYCPNDEWRADEEMLVYRSARSRFRIIPETATGFADIWRDDKLAELGIYSACIDGEAFGRRLLETLFYHCSPHDEHHVIKALQKSIAEWELRTGRKMNCD